MEIEIFNKLFCILVYVDIDKLKDNTYRIYFDIDKYIIYDYEISKTLDYNIDKIKKMIETKILSEYFL